MLKQPWEEVVMDGQIFPASLLKVNKYGPQYFLDCLYGLFCLSIAFRVAASSVCEHGPRLASSSGHSSEQVSDGRFLVHPYFEAAVMAHPAKVAEDLLDGVLGTRPFCIYYMACNELGLIVHNRQCSKALLSWPVARDEVVRTDGGAVGVLHVGLHLQWATFPPWVFVVPFAACHTALAPWVIGNVRKAVVA